MPEENVPKEVDMPEFDALIGKPGEAVPAVDPIDLKALWAYSQELRAKYPNGGVATGIEVLKHMCSPGADTRAVTCRCQMLGLLELMLESAWPGGQPSESAFKVAARMELNWMGVGVVQKGLPFDVERFLGEVQGEKMFGGAMLVRTSQRSRSVCNPASDLLLAVLQSLHGNPLRPEAPESRIAHMRNFAS